MTRSTKTTLAAGCAAILMLVAAPGCTGNPDDALEFGNDASSGSSTDGGDITQQQGDLYISSVPSVRGVWRTEVREAFDDCGVVLDASGPRDIAIVQHGGQLVLTAREPSGACKSFPANLTGVNVLERDSHLIADENGTCVVRVETTYALSFSRNTFQGAEEYVVDYVSGDCGSLLDRCTWILEAEGQRCTDCEQACAGLPDLEAPRIGGPFGWPAGSAIADLIDFP